MWQVDIKQKGEFRPFPIGKERIGCHVRHCRIYRREQAAPILLNGLQKLEYRGYDSAGVAVYNDSGVHVVKSKGRLSVLDGILQGGKELPGTVGIGHTRWATHGAPSDVNSHPQVSDGGLFAVVHNGIIENYLYLKTTSSAGAWSSSPIRTRKW